MRWINVKCAIVWVGGFFSVFVFSAGVASIFVTPGSLRCWIDLLVLHFHLRICLLALPFIASYCLAGTEYYQLPAVLMLYS